MANQKSPISISAGLVEDLNAALRGCQMSARGFFFALIPLFESGQVLGFLDMDTEQLSQHFSLSLHHTRRYLYELKRKGILRVTHDGTLVCHLIIKKHYQIGGYQ